jgi:pyruvate kinase
MESIHRELESLAREMELAVESKKKVIDALHPSQKISAENLIRYLVLRSRDVRPLQDKLHLFGLSSLASSESHILRQIQAILNVSGKQIDAADLSECDYQTCRKLVQHRSRNLFGVKTKDSIPYIMVTFDTHFADDFKLIKELLKAGMNIARINCAHDDEKTWKKMVDLIRAAAEETAIPCQIYMDLAGPKIRTRILGKGRSEGKVALSVGEEIVLAATNPDFDPENVVIGMSEPQVIAQLKPGKTVLFDDGLIEAQVTNVANGVATLKILRVSEKKSQLKADKGINFPGTSLPLPALSEQDKMVLPFVCRHADLVGYSFVRRASDVQELQNAIASFPKKPSIILKIETAEAVEAFPSLLLQGMREEFFGVMIARGDLAVEIGFERLSEIQEELLWISEAGHVPIIWATQVLESLNKSGLATRSEVTDASYSVMAECVMINKGDYVVSVVRSLTDILQRSGAHHIKKRYPLRPLHIAIDYLS